MKENVAKRRESMAQMNKRGSTVKSAVESRVIINDGVKLTRTYKTWILASARMTAGSRLSFVIHASAGRHLSSSAYMRGARLFLRPNPADFYPRPTD